jgi:hypothetical protein
MLLTLQHSCELLAKHGIFAREICDKCGLVLGAVRFTRRGELGAWCSRECRGDQGERVVRKGGRPRKYRTEAARLSAEKSQNAERQKSFRGRVQRNGKPPRSLPETKDLQGQKSPLSHYPLTRCLAARKTALSENGGVMDVRPGEREIGVELLTKLNLQERVSKREAAEGLGLI